MLIPLSWALVIPCIMDMVLLPPQQQDGDLPREKLISSLHFVVTCISFLFFWNVKLSITWRKSNTAFLLKSGTSNKDWGQILGPIRGENYKLFSQLPVPTMFDCRLLCDENNKLPWSLLDTHVWLLKDDIFSKISQPVDPESLFCTHVWLCRYIWWETFQR